MRTFTLIILSAIALTGCSDNNAPKTPAPRSGIVQDLTGANMINQGRSAKTQLDAVNKAVRERSGEDVE
jgi:uncharacterized protein YcfL